MKIKTSKFEPVRLYMYSNTWPVYGFGFTYLGYPWNLKHRSVRSDQSVNILTLKISICIACMCVCVHPGPTHELRLSVNQLHCATL